MNFVSIPTLITVVISVIHSVSSSDCSMPIGNIDCECTYVSIRCSGTQTYVSEVEDALIFAKFSQMDIVVLEIQNLTFRSNFTFGNTSISHLVLRYGLQNLSSNVFSNSSSIVILDLGYNSFLDIDDQLFSSLPALERLFLDENELYDLRPSMFEKLTKLKILSIEKNNFFDIERDVFENLPVLETLILNENNVSSIENLRLKCRSLTQLIATHCSIKGAFEKDSFSGVPNLRHLDLSHNELAEVKSYSLSALKDLESLDLSYNTIRRLEEYAFSELKNLTWLDLMGNRISVVKETGFANLNNLKYLDLSGNNLSAVLCHYTTDFDSLEEIYLQDNQIKTFTQGAFFFSPKLMILNITGNKLECSCALTNSALHLIENTTMEKEDFWPISCNIMSKPNTSSSIMEYNDASCANEEPCKKVRGPTPDSDATTDGTTNTATESTKKKEKDFLKVILMPLITNFIVSLICFYSP